MPKKKHKKKKHRVPKILEIFESELSFKWALRHEFLPPEAKQASFQCWPSPALFADKQALILLMQRRAQQFFAQEGYQQVGDMSLYGCRDTEGCYVKASAYAIPKRSMLNEVGH